MAPASLSKLQGTLPLSTAATPQLQTAVWDSLDGVYNVIHRSGAGPDLLALHLRDLVTRLEARPVCHRPLNHLWDPDPRQEVGFNYANRADLQQRWLGVSAGADMCCILHAAARATTCTLTQASAPKALRLSLVCPPRSAGWTWQRCRWQRRKQALDILMSKLVEHMFS